MVTQQQKGLFFVVMGTLLFSSKAIIVKMLFQIGLGALLQDLLGWMHFSGLVD
jgi:hypothetical protein